MATRMGRSLLKCFVIKMPRITSTPSASARTGSQHCLLSATLPWEEGACLGAQQLCSVSFPLLSSAQNPFKGSSLLLGKNTDSSYGLLVSWPWPPFSSHPGYFRSCGSKCLLFPIVLLFFLPEILSSFCFLRLTPTIISVNV